MAWGVYRKINKIGMKREEFFPRLDHIEAFLLSYLIGPVHGRGEYDSHLITFCKHVFRYDLIFCSLRILILGLNKRGVNEFFFFFFYPGEEQ